MSHEFTGEVIQNRAPTTTPTRLRIKALPDFIARHHPAQWELVNTGTPERPHYEWLPRVRMRRITPGASGVYCNKDGVISQKTVTAALAVGEAKGWIHLEPAEVGSYRRAIKNCKRGRTHHCWAWHTYTQLPGLNPACIVDKEMEHDFRRSIIGKVIKGRTIVPTQPVKAAQVQQALKNINRVMKLKETPMTQRELGALQVHLDAMERTPLPTGPVAKPSGRKVVKPPTAKKTEPTADMAAKSQLIAAIKLLEDSTGEDELTAARKSADVKPTARITTMYGLGKLQRYHDELKGDGDGQASG